MAAEEINAMADGNLLKSSLEIYSPLDGANVFSADPIVNLAQSTNKVSKVNLISGTYYLQNRFSRLYMDVDDNLITQDGANIQQWGYMGTSNQQFTFTHLGNDVYKIICAKSAKSIDVSGVSTADGANVQQWGYVSWANQQFSMVPVDSDYYKIVAKHSGKLVEVSGFSTVNGGNVQQWADANQISGQWKLIRVNTATPATIRSTMKREDITGISVYPNPAVTTLYVHGVKNAVIIEVFNSSGQLQMSSFGRSIAVERLKAGVYFVQLKSKGVDQVFKFIKQ
jgi:hypothetical protein